MTERLIVDEILHSVVVDEINNEVVVRTGWPDGAKKGANSDISSLNGITGGIQTPTFVDFSTSATVADATGRVTWNDAAGTLQVGMAGNIQSDIGQTLYAYVHNAEAVQINKGQPVYLYQATGNKASVRLAYNTSDAYSAKTLGLAAQNIPAGNNGMVICQGVIDGINTGSFSEGATLYLGATAGSLTSSKPSAPNHLVYIGVVERANAGNGQIYVRPQNGYELEELHNVQIVSPANGQTIIYDNATGLWKNANITAGSGITVTNGGGTITISAAGGGGGTGTVTSVDVSGGTTGLTTSGGPVTGSGTITLAGTLAIANGGTGATTAPNARTALSVPATDGTGASGTWGISVSGNAATVTNGVYTTGSYSDPAWITSISGSKVSGGISGNAGTVTNGVYTTGSYSDPAWITSLSGSKVSGNITGNAANVTGTVAVGNGGTGVVTLTGLVKGNGTSAFTAASAGTDYLAPFGSQTQAYVYAAPSGSAGVPSFRALVASDIPTLNQNTTGTASNVTGTVAIANGGSGQTSAQAAINAFAGAVTSGQYLRGNGTNVVMSAIQAADVPTLNQNTTGTAANVTGTVAVANGGTGATDAATARSNLSAQKVITSGTASPTGGNDGDIYLQYT